MGFTPIDYLILTVYLIATAAFGSFLGKGQKNVKDYFLGGQKLPWWAICFSIVATETSTLTFIGAPAIAYSGNLTFLQVAFGYLVGKLLVCFILIPGYFKGEIQTAYDVLHKRFGGRVRDLSALIFQVTRMLADGVRLFATALVLSVVTNLSDIWTVIIIGIVTVVYTFYGGMTAVVWNDFIQLIIYVGGALLAFYMILYKLPSGWDSVLEVSQPLDKFQVLNFDWVLSEPYTVFAGLIGGAFLTFATHGTDQMMVQRYLACGNQFKSQLALIVSGVFVILQFLLFLLIGLLLFSFYNFYPLNEEIDQINRIFPIFIVQEMPPGVSGLIIAAIFAAAMSSLSSSLNSLSSSTLNDFYRARFRPDSSDLHYLRVSRVMTIGWGVVLMLISMLARTWGEVLEAGLTITSFTMGSLLGVFLIGQTQRAVSQFHVISGMITGLMVMAIIHQFTSLAWTWYVLVGTIATTAVCLIGSKGSLSKVKD